MTKKRLLYWGDGPAGATGFGVVARHVLRALHRGGHEIDCLAVNAVADFHDRDDVPYAVVPAAVMPQDPLGYRMLLRALTRRRYDALFIQNDLHVGHAAADYLVKLRDRGTALPPIVYYYPVDCRVRPNLTGMLQLADVIVTCTAYGRGETVKTLPARTPLVIPHGVDTHVFRPAPDPVAARARFRAAHDIGADCFLVSSVAVNSPRKDLARAIAAFARFKERRRGPAVLYLHTNPVDNGLDLNEAVVAAGLTGGQDVVFPKGYHPLQGLPDQAMNDLYNASDLYFTTTLGEGWGLPVTEAMAAGLPVVAPRNTSLVELAGEGRAILYECRESIWIDNSGYRPQGHMSDIVAALEQGASLGAVERRRMTDAARDFVTRLDWTLVAPRWLPVVDALAAGRSSAA